MCTRKRASKHSTAASVARTDRINEHKSPLAAPCALAASARCRRVQVSNAAFAAARYILCTTCSVWIQSLE